MERTESGCFFETMKLQKLLDEIAAGTLLPGQMFVRDDLDAILDHRDEEGFETPWLACSERIQTAWEQASPDANNNLLRNRESMTQQI